MILSRKLYLVVILTLFAFTAWETQGVQESDYDENCPTLSPDGKYFFFNTTRSGNWDIYWVDAKIIEDLKPKELK